MNNQEKRHRTSMQHLRYLNSFMDEIDREVMSLTDRAFKSLCIGDEAIYNDSEFSPSPVSCHKPKVEDVSTVKKLNSYPLNGATDLLIRPSRSSRKNGESVKMTNGDLWDKSTLLSIQRELSSGYHRLTAEHNSQAKNHFKADEESMPSGKSLKSKHSKNNTLRKLNCINFFLHSEFSPFLSWRDFNKFSIGQEHISEILLNDRSPEWYDSPLYKELTAAHGHYKISSPTSVEKEGEQKETHSPEPQPAPVQSAAPIVPPKPDKEHIRHNIPTKAPPLATEQRCNSERAEPCAPWRKSRSRAKSAAPVGHSIINSPSAGERSAQTSKKDVKTIEDQTSASSTPFSISQLLTPVIPSRHGTGTSEILQTVLSPTSLEIPALPERELHPSPEIKREGYKSIASSLLFNLKDNRKRVKTMYSPPKFKGSDAANQTKVSPQPEGSKDGLEIREISESETVSPARHRAIITPMSPLLETADTQTCSPVNGRVPDDYLGLSLLQSGKVKSNRSPAANKATYPSLHLYRKNSPEEISVRVNSQTVVETSSQVFKDKATKDHDTECTYPSKSVKGVEPESNRPTMGFNRSSVSLANTDEETISEDTNPMKDRCIVSAQKSPVKEKAGAKHAFSARQNNYIKSQRFVSKDDDSEKGSLRVDDGRSRPAKSAQTKHVEERNVRMHKDGPLLKERGEAITDQSSVRRKGNNDTMKGNTSAKRALFASIEHGSSKTNAPLRKENVVMDKYDLAKLALEEVIAEREQRKLRNNVEASLTDRKGVSCVEPQDCIELTANIEKQLPIMGMQEAKGQNSAKTNWQTVETLPEDMAKHGESHVPEIKLARPCKQDASIGQCQHLEPIKYNERDRSCLDSQVSSADNVSKGDKICKKKELINKNSVKKAAKRSENLQSSDIRLVPQCEEELGADQKPEVPPRRGRSNSQDNDRVGENTESKLVFRREGDTTVKTEETESREVSKVQSSQSKIRGPVRGNVTALKEKYDKESKKVLSAESTCSENSGKEGHAEKTPKDKMKHTFVTPKLTVSDPESGTSTIIYKEMDSESEIMSSSSKESDHSNPKGKHSITQKNPSDITSNRKEVMQDDKVKVNGKEGYAVLLKELEDKQNKSKQPTKSYVKDFLNGLLGLSNSEKVKIDCEEELSETEPSFRTDKGRKDSITVYDILGKPHSAYSMNGKPTLHSSRSSNSSDFSLLHDSEPEFLRKTEEKINWKVKENIQEPTMDSCSLSNHESESDISDRVVSPPSDVDKRGWVHSLIESARDFPQIPHSHGSSKDQQEIGQQLSQKENDEEDLDAPIPVISIKSPPPSQPAMHFLSLPASHLVAVKERKLSAGSVSVSEEEERRSAVSTLSEGLDGYETSGGDPMEENISSTAPTEDADGSKEPSERSASACSGNDNHGQNKPPVVPPKTEKALRRAMKLTTRRIQKAERKGRSSDKSVSQKAERSTDKAHDRSEHRSLSSDRISGHLNDTRSEKHDRRHDDQKSQHIEENDPSKKLPHATKGEDQPTSQTGDSKRDHLENGNLSNDCDRLGRSNEKHLPKKLDRRTQSLDRFLKDKRENISSSTGAVSSELSTEGSQYSTPKALPLPHNSIEHTYAPASNLVTQSFPITQRKLLQDPDSGQYFLVDMPVQVKTKTFFDPETKSYVQLPVQSPEAAPPLEVMNTPPLVVFHGFVPVPVPSQKSVVRTQGSVIPLDDLEDFEPSRKQIQEDFCQTQNEPVYISQEHTPEEEIDSVR